MKNRHFTPIAPDAFHSFGDTFQNYQQMQEAAEKIGAMLSAVFDLVDNNGQTVRNPEERKRQLLTMLDMTRQDVDKIARTSARLDYLMQEAERAERAYRQQNAER